MPVYRHQHVAKESTHINTATTAQYLTSNATMRIPAQLLSNLKSYTSKTQSIHTKLSMAVAVTVTGSIFFLQFYKVRAATDSRRLDGQPNGPVFDGKG